MGPGFVSKLGEPSHRPMAAATSGAIRCRANVCTEARNPFAPPQESADSQDAEVHQSGGHRPIGQPPLSYKIASRPHSRNENATHERHDRGGFGNHEGRPKKWDVALMTLGGPELVHRSSIASTFGFTAPELRGPTMAG
jgi:hypothetical protein